jgi:hypothetical protein
MGLRWRDVIVIALTFALAWGLRGQHGHEKGSALVGAMAGLCFAAVTGGSRWIGSAVIGSLSFALGGSLSYGKFVQLAYQGSWEAIVSLIVIGVVWGGLGALGLGLGLALSKYKVWERGVIAGGLFLVWFLVDRLLWYRMTGPNDLATRELMAGILLGAWVFLCAYVGVWRGDRTSLRLAVAGAIGFGVAFPIAAWLQGVGNMTGWPIDWWKIAEHMIGLFGGFAIALAAKNQQPTWSLPLAVRPWERWLACAWLLWLLPSWLFANNLDYWIDEKAWFPAEMANVAWFFICGTLVAFAAWGWLQIRQGRTFVTSWLPHHLRTLFLVFVWVTTLIACGKTAIVEGVFHSTPLGFLLFALIITRLIQADQTNTA